MMIYEITHDDGIGSAVCITKHREDAAMRALYAEVYDALERNGLRDRPVAHIAMKRVNSWTKRHPIEPIRILDHVITISAERLPD